MSAAVESASNSGKPVAENLRLVGKTRNRVVTFPDPPFEEKYPPDPVTKECAEHARVWEVYRDEAREHDMKQLDGWNKTLDILLLFAGLYSAVVTAFLIEAYRMLSQDPTDYVASTLFRFISSDHGAVPVISPDTSPAEPPGSGFSTPTLVLWVNGLWFSSLILTLSVALLCMLVKQWLTEYEAVVLSPAPTAHYWTLRHVYHSKGLRTWGVPFLISFLPSFLHIALFVFILGLNLFLLPFNTRIAVGMAGIGGAVLVFYLLHFALSIWDPSCAFRSPLARQIRHGAARLFRRTSRAQAKSVVIPRPRLREPEAGEKLPDNEQTREEMELRRLTPELDAGALLWLMSSSTRSVTSVAIQAIGALRPTSPTAFMLRHLGSHHVITRYMSSRGLEMQDLSEEELDSESAVSETSHCAKALLCLASWNEVPFISPFTDLNISLAEDAKLFNRLVWTVSGQYYDNSLFLASLEDVNSGPEMPIERSTLLVLLDHIGVRLELPNVDNLSFTPGPAEFKSAYDSLPDSGRVRALHAHFQMVVHLVHALGVKNLRKEDIRTIVTELVWCDEKIVFEMKASIKHVFPSTLLDTDNDPSTLLDTDNDSRPLLLATWVCIAAQAKHHAISNATEDVLRRDITTMALDDRFVNSPSYWINVLLAPSLDLQWTASDLDGLIFLCQRYPIVMDPVMAPYVRRAVASLLNWAGRLPVAVGSAQDEMLIRSFGGLFKPAVAVSASLLNSAGELPPKDAVSLGGTFAAFFRLDWSAWKPSEELDGSMEDVSNFVDPGEAGGTNSAWRVLHKVICADMEVNGWVVQLTILLVSALRKALLLGPDDAVQKWIDRLFAVDFLAPCFLWMSSFPERYSSNDEEKETALQSAAKLLADCACLSSSETSRQLCSITDPPPSSPVHTPSQQGIVFSYLGTALQHDPRAPQSNTMAVFRHAIELADVRRFSDLSAGENSAAIIRFPRALVESCVKWVFWSRPAFTQHLAILTAARECSERVLKEQQDQAVEVPYALASFIKELLQQDAHLDVLSDGLTINPDKRRDYGAYRLFDPLVQDEGELPETLKAALEVMSARH